jgi:phosphoribosyl-AMP cyclohydrolase / phosphoribosyl-ATP pyrophosphohydrolase
MILPRIDQIAWDKLDGLIPAVVQHFQDASVLMVGFMNRAALDVTLATGHVTFFSRSKQRLWTKGESSGHFLKLHAIALDCDDDTVLIQAEPHGPTCHRGTKSCFDAAEVSAEPLLFLRTLEQLIDTRYTKRPAGSYTTQLFESGTRRIAQKVGEEGLETALAAVAQGRDEVVGEAADLVFHLMVLLRDRALTLNDVIACLRARHG